MVVEELGHLPPDSDPSEENIIKNVAATMYAAGADTVVSAMSSFFLVMSLYPEVQSRGQKELDSVIGFGQRLPLFTDRPQLPYLVRFALICYTTALNNCYYRITFVTRFILCSFQS
jgi:cytochrome P450